MIALSRIAAAAALGALAWAGEPYTREQLKARFYYDLGPAEVDVSSYPEEQQANYAVFSRTCSQCHSPARPLNAPIVSRKDWKRYVLRMNLRTQVRPGTKITKEEAREIVDFLVFDSRRRKVEQKAAFDAKTGELKALFEQVKKERGRLQIEQDKKKVRDYGMEGAGERPRP